MLVLDITMPDRSGLDILKELKHQQPDLPVLVLSIHAEEQFAVRLLKAGASGYLTKENAPDELVKAIRKVVDGGKYISQSLAESLAFSLDVASDRPRHETLSDREFQVMQLMAGGKTLTELPSPELGRFLVIIGVDGIRSITSQIQNGFLKSGLLFIAQACGKLLFTVNRIINTKNGINSIGNGGGSMC